MKQNVPRRQGRPRNIEREHTVMTGGQLASWPISKTGHNYFELYNPDQLMGRHGFKIYREMLNDDTVKACLRFKKVLVTGRVWDVEPAGGQGATEQDKKIADFVKENIKRVSWNRIQREMLTSLDFGFSVGEILWEVGDIGEHTTKVLLKDVKHRDPEFLKIDVDRHGNIVGLRQQADWPPMEVSIEPERILLMSNVGEFQNHYGSSDLRGAYRAWWSKKFVTQFWNVFLERFGSPLMMMKYPQGATDELKAALRSILTNLSSKTDILVPEGVVVDLIEATRGGNAGYGEALAYFDIGISRALLVPALIGLGAQAGRSADSQSRLQLRTMMKIISDLSMDMENEINRKLVKPLVDMNFPNVKEHPRYRYKDYNEYEAVEVIDATNSLFNSGILDLDQDDINSLRSVLGLRLREEGEEDEVLRSMPPPLGTSPNDPNASGSGAKPGNDRAKKGPATAPTTRKT